MRRTCTAVVVGCIALALATPGTAQAPTLDQRVEKLESEVQSLESRLRTLEASHAFLDEHVFDLSQRTNAVEMENVQQRVAIDHLQIKAGAVEKRAACTRDAIAVSIRGTRDLFLTRHDAQRKVYLGVVDRSCLAGTRDDYRFPGFRGAP